MYLLVGLGNPGPQHEGQRHNAGAMVLETVARRAGAQLASSRYRGLFARTTVGGESAGLLLPETFMNLSGESVGPAARFFKIPPDQILVVHDELDLPFGTLRLKAGGGLAGHNGLKSIAQHLGTRDFLRLRFGIGRPIPPRDVVAHVLSPFSPDETLDLEAHLRRGADAVALTLSESLKIAMRTLHAPSGEPPKTTAVGRGDPNSGDVPGPARGKS